MRQNILGRASKQLPNDVVGVESKAPTMSLESGISTTTAKRRRWSGEQSPNDVVGEWNLQSNSQTTSLELRAKPQRCRCKMRLRSFLNECYEELCPIDV